jgi:hypothetical protein
MVEEILSNLRKGAAVPVNTWSLFIKVHSGRSQRKTSLLIFAVVGISFG